MFRQALERLLSAFDGAERSTFVVIALQTAETGAPARPQWW